jgi:hypothetical protein
MSEWCPKTRVTWRESSEYRMKPRHPLVRHALNIALPQTHRITRPEFLSDFVLKVAEFQVEPLKEVE